MGFYFYTNLFIFNSTGLRFAGRASQKICYIYIYRRSDLQIDVVRCIWLHIYCQWRICILNQLSICACMGCYTNSFIFDRVFAGRAPRKISYILRPDLQIDVVVSIRLHIYCQWCICILNQLSICVCMGCYTNSFIFDRCSISMY